MSHFRRGFLEAAPRLSSGFGVSLVLATILRVTGQPLGWVLLYAWHPLPPIEGVGGAHVICSASCS